MRAQSVAMQREIDATIEASYRQSLGPEEELDAVDLHLDK